MSDIGLTPTKSLKTKREAKLYNKLQQKAITETSQLSNSEKEGNPSEVEKQRIRVLIKTELYQ